MMMYKFVQHCLVRTLREKVDIDSKSVYNVFTRKTAVPRTVAQPLCYSLCHAELGYSSLEFNAESK